MWLIRLELERQGCSMFHLFCIVAALRVYTREAETLTGWVEGYRRGTAWSVGRRNLVPSRKRQPQLPKLLHHAHTMATPKNKNICKVILPA